MEKSPATNNYLIGWENNSSWWQTNQKMNPKRRVCKIPNNFQKAGVMLWQSNVLRRLWHRITDATQQDGGGVMAWACMAVSGTGPLNFTDDLMYDDSSRMNLEGYKTILPNNIQENNTRLIGKCFILHQADDPKHPVSSVKEFIRAKK